MIRILAIGIETKLPGDLKREIGKEDCNIITANAGSEALMLLQKEEVDLVILDPKLSNGDGVHLIVPMKRIRPFMEIIVIVGWASVETAVKAMKLGAFDCLCKPVKTSELRVIVAKAYAATRLRERKELISGERADGLSHEFVGESKQIKKVKKLISLLGPSAAPVLVLGETGTGKELVARAIHRTSDRSDGPFVAVNMSALPENILESELFGYKKGAFTGALSDKAGLLEIADGGTFFADEVGDISQAIQAKLLRVIETGTFRKLGDVKETKVNVRLISATNKDLDEECKRRVFRSDLFYRLSTFVIEIPSLRERREDIPLLADYFLSRISKGGCEKRISSQAFGTLFNYRWPGNVRELMNVLERAVLFSPDKVEIDADALCLHVDDDEFEQPFGGVKGFGAEKYLLEDIGRQHIEKVMEVAKGNKTLAARLLGISRATLYRRLSSGYPISRPILLKRSMA